MLSPDLVVTDDDENALGSINLAYYSPTGWRL
jgi:hypothetical protein